MSSWIRVLRERLHLLKSTSVRTEQIQDELSELRGLAEQHADLLRQTRDLTTSLRQLVGEGFADAAAGRSRALALQEESRRAIGGLRARELADTGNVDWLANQFSVYSQFGEDGLIQLLLREVPVTHRTFVEFGVEDYREATTRFLLVNNRWSGLVLDGSDANMAALKQEQIYQWLDLQAATAFVTRENINDILRANGREGEIGLLCIDIDGNDYWVWEAIDAVSPTIVVIEYNYRFGPEISVVVPYDPHFVKNDAHPSAIYYGASLTALCRLARKKGFAFVGCSNGGVNAFFVRRDHLPVTLRELQPSEGYVAGQHAEMRGPDGRITKPSLAVQQALLLSLPLVEIEGANIV